MTHCAHPHHPPTTRFSFPSPSNDHTVADDHPSIEEASADVVAAAHSIYVDSGRTAADWAEFVQSVSHAMSVIPHGFARGAPQLRAGELFALPKQGVDPAAAAEASSLGQCEQAQFESLVDEFYATQGYRHSLHTGMADLLQSGSTVPNPGVSDLRLMGATSYRSLKDMFVAQDLTLEAIFLQYRDNGGASNPQAYRSFVHSLLTLSTQWRRFLFFHSDPQAFRAQSAALFAILDELLKLDKISMGEMDYLENVLYDSAHPGAPLKAENEEEEQDGPQAKEVGQTAASQFLLAAWAECWQVLSSSAEAASSPASSSPSPDAIVAPPAHSQAILEFYDSLLHLLDRQMNLIYRQYCSEAKIFLAHLQRNRANYDLPPASLKHLCALVKFQEEMVERNRRAGAQGTSVVLSPTEEILSKQSQVLYACFAESAQSQNVYELIDSLQVVGESWSKVTPHQSLLNCLRYLAENQLITAHELQQAEALVYDSCPALIEAWSVYEAADYSKPAFAVFREAVQTALEAQFNAEMEDLARLGYALLNAWSIHPDPTPALYRDSVRNEVLGLPAKLELREPAPEFPLPEHMARTLSAQHSQLLRAMVARRDPVLLALLHEFQESSNMDDLIDSLERLLAREIVAIQEQVAAEEAAKVEGAENALALDMYQLSQMLLSLHHDGYLSTQSLYQLLRAVQEDRHPVLLAAFAAYKDAIATDSPHRHWPEMWETLQMVWQKIQAEEAAAAAAQSPPPRQQRRHPQPISESEFQRLGSSLIDRLSVAQKISIPNTLYLRDQLQARDADLERIINVYLVEGDRRSGTTPHTTQRWTRE